MDLRDRQETFRADRIQLILNVHSSRLPATKHKASMTLAGLLADPTITSGSAALKYDKMDEATMRAFILLATRPWDPLGWPAMPE